MRETGSRLGTHPPKVQAGAVFAMCLTNGHARTASALGAPPRPGLDGSRLPPGLFLWSLSVLHTSPHIPRRCGPHTGSAPPPVA